MEPKQVMILLVALLGLVIVGLTSRHGAEAFVMPVHRPKQMMHRESLTGAGPMLGPMAILPDKDAQLMFKLPNGVITAAGGVTQAPSVVQPAIQEEQGFKVPASVTQPNEPKKQEPIQVPTSILQQSAVPPPQPAQIAPPMSHADIEAANEAADNLVTSKPKDAKQPKESISSRIFKLGLAFGRR